MVMTSQELRALGLARFGPEWQSPLARAIGRSPRTIRRIASGESPISLEIEAEIRRVFGSADKASTEWPRDEWIVGDGPEHAAGERREYLVHTRHPRFIARIAAVDLATDEIEPHEGETDGLTGVVYASNDSLICEIVWFDPPPGPAALARLMDAAADALEGSD